MTEDFTGVKIALFTDDKLIVIQRDDKPGLRYANMWDFPGGAREDNENPIECVTREVKEELNIDLDPSSIVWQKEFPAMHDANLIAYFMVAKVSHEQVKGIEFGDEGQGWKLMSVEDCFAANDTVEPLKGRLRDYLDNSSSGSSV